MSSVAWGLGYFGMPHILVRFMSIDNPAEVKGSRRIAMTWVFISLGAAVMIGLVGHLFLKQRGMTLAQFGDDPEKIFIIMVNGLFNTGVCARILAGILLSAILAAIMSTADSQLLVSASAFSNDLYKVLFRKRSRTARPPSASSSFRPPTCPIRRRSSMCNPQETPSSTPASPRGAT